MKTVSFLKGVGLGLVVGSVVTAATVPHKKNGKNVICKALRSIGDVLDNITDSIG